MFSINAFEDRLQKYVKEKFNVQSIFERSTINNRGKEDNICIIIKLTGHETDVNNASEDLASLFLSLRTRKFEDQTGKRE